jgi:nitrous oxidase accessory protein NosD
LGEITNTIKKSKKLLCSEANKKVRLEVNTEKMQYMVMPHHQTAGQNHNLVSANKSFGNMTKVKYLGTTVNK